MQISGLEVAQSTWTCVTSVGVCITSAQAYQVDGDRCSEKMLGIALGVAAVITVVSVMNGFERELRGHILGMAAHATIAGANDNAIKDWRQQAGIAEQHPRVIGVAPYVDGQAMVTQGGRVRGVLVRGVQPCLLYTSPSPRDKRQSRMPSSA